MAEPIKDLGSHLVISPEDRSKQRTWPNPVQVQDLVWRLLYAPSAITAQDRVMAASFLSAYAHIFSLSQREFLPTHAAVREHLRGRVGHSHG
jgi:hypothetical protein